MSDPSKKPSSTSGDDLRIHRDDLDDVLAIAARLQATAKDAGDDTFEGDELDAITATTGIDRAELVVAKRILDDRRRTRRRWALGAMGGFVVLAGLTGGLWWPRVFPPDPKALALEASQLTEKAQDLRGDKAYDAAFKAALEATRKDPTNFKAWNMVGLGYFDANKPVEARAAYLEGIRLAGIQPDADDLYYNMASLINDVPATHEEAVGYFKQALQCNPNHTRSHNNLGYTYEKMGHVKEAILSYEAALKADPANATARNNLASLRKRTEPTPSLASVTDKLKAVEARDAISKLHKAGKYREAIARGHQAVKAYPKEVQVWNELGIAYMEDGQKVEAARIFTKATEVGGMTADTVYPYYNLGRLASETSDDKVAIAYLRKAIACNPAHGWTHQYLAKALERQGQKAEAIAEYRAALKAKPGLTEARDALSRLGALP